MIPFSKMHGLGNDFVVVDNRDGTLPPLNWRAIADRHFGIGCDQGCVLERSAHADVFMRIYNADGGVVSSCGNLSRCVAWLLAQEKSAETITIETSAGVLTAQVKSEQEITIDMGVPALAWHEIPLSHEADTLHLPIAHETLRDPVAVSMGNPHCVFFVPDIDSIPLEQWGKALEHHALFPERTNVEIAHIKGNEIFLRVWERGSGLTLACGTGACATLVAAYQRGLTGRQANVHLPGGMLSIAWQESSGHVLMTGPAALVFKGELSSHYFTDN